MAKLKDCSTKLVNLAESEDFKVLLGDLGEELAAMAGSGDRFFDTYGAGKLMLINSKLPEDLRRVAVAQLMTVYENQYKESLEDFYVELKKSDLRPESVLEVLIDEKLFAKRFKKHSKSMSYNDTIMTLSKEFMVKPSLVAKYAKRK